MVPNWKPFKCPSTQKMNNKFIINRHLSIIEYYTTIKRNVLLLQATFGWLTHIVEAKKTGHQKVYTV